MPTDQEIPNPDDPRVGLCARCRFVRAQTTVRGAIFYRCARADEDASFLRYPQIPVLTCTGFELDESRANEKPSGGHSGDEASGME